MRTTRLVISSNAPFAWVVLSYVADSGAQSTWNADEPPSINFVVVRMTPLHGFIIPSDDASDGQRSVCSRVHITS